MANVEASELTKHFAAGVGWLSQKLRSQPPLTKVCKYPSSFADVCTRSSPQAPDGAYESSALPLRPPSPARVDPISKAGRPRIFRYGRCCRSGRLHRVFPAPVHYTHLLGTWGSGGVPNCVSVSPYLLFMQVRRPARRRPHPPARGGAERESTIKVTPSDCSPRESFVTTNMVCLHRPTLLLPPLPSSPEKEGGKSHWGRPWGRHAEQ